MRLDDFLSTAGIIKRRTVAKQIADGGRIKVNGSRAKPAHKIKVNDIIDIGGTEYIKLAVTQIPGGKSVPKATREEYYRILERAGGEDSDA